MCIAVLFAMGLWGCWALLARTRTHAKVSAPLWGAVLAGSGCLGCGEGEGSAGDVKRRIIGYGAS